MQILRRTEPLRVGFLPASDCAPLAYAQEAGLFQKYEVEVELVRETRLATLRDKVIEGELDAAHVTASLPFLANLGIEADPCSCVAGMVLNLQGNAVILSKALAEDGVKDAAGLRERIFRLWGKKTYTFGVVFPLSSQLFLLRQWLRSGEINPETQVRIVVAPPSQMFPMLKLGYLDGFCTGEPWSSMAVQAGVGVCVSGSMELAPLHPEKVLMARQGFAAGRAAEHEQLLAALLEACAACELPQNRAELAEMLAQPHYVNAPPETLEAGIPCASSSAAKSLPGQNIYNRFNANDPTNEKAAWVMERLYEALEPNLFKRNNHQRTPVLKNVFRRDIFERASALVGEKRAPRENAGAALAASR